MYQQGIQKQLSCYMIVRIFLWWSISDSKRGYSIKTYFVFEKSENKRTTCAHIV